MIPLRDIQRSQSIPFVNYLLIAINVVAFLWELGLGKDLEKAFFLYGLVPLRYSDPTLAFRFTLWEQAIPFLTSMFLHGGLFHLLGNMWSLFIFGDNVEDRLGHLRYLLFYLTCGLVAGVTHLMTNLRSPIPTIGASGAISGVMGAYFLLFPTARVLTLVPFFFFFQFVELPAFLFLGIWFLIQILSAGVSSGGAGGVAWWAHIGGFLGGMILVKLFQLIPRIGLDRELSLRTLRKGTPRIQPLSVLSPREDLHVRGWIAITPWEASLGTRKMIVLREGLRQRRIMVRIPPGVRDGTVLRLAGLGRRGWDGEVGDLFLEIRVM